MPKKSKNLTWGKLKELCDQLSPDELKGIVKWIGEERGGNVVSAERVEEDYVQTDYGCEPAWVQEYLEGDEHYPICWPKGMPILFVD